MSYVPCLGLSDVFSLLDSGCVLWAGKPQKPRVFLSVHLVRIPGVSSGQVSAREVVTMLRSGCLPPGKVKNQETRLVGRKAG